VCSKGPTVRSLRSDSRAFSAKAAAKAAASIASDGGGAVLTAEETRTIRHCRTFSTCLPTSCGSPPPARPPALPPVHQAPSPAAVAWPFDLDDDDRASVVVSRRDLFLYTARRAYIRRLHPDWAARPALMRRAASGIFWEGLLLLLHRIGETPA
jgi:hypothetical protein